MGRWGDGEMGRLGDWEMGRLRDGEMGRWGDWGIGSVREIKKYISSTITMQDYLFVEVGVRRQETGDRRNGNYKKI
ncbi:MAG: hypothetical protein F6K54_21330 [Okeania sp. SIO3B5]|uniref:hypothetical protein n=1 Tax=Okeania sp. SIO3B5 TaxID=2607811 RepID=UPI0013FFEC08|nr:hypothetical protein [Okeania sp. SIO3B5]NEO55384.1 hypothetical protein [Okeania sp. SIO3B5]